MSEPRTETFTQDDIAFGKELFAAASQYIEQPYISHAAIVGCGSKRTTAGCMDIGIDSSGFDCMGLVIRAASDVYRRSDPEWAIEVRHTAQAARRLGRVPVDWREDLPVGSLMVYSHTAGTVHVPAAHIGIYAGESKVLHARSYTRAGVPSEKVAIDEVRAPWASKRFEYVLALSALRRLTN